MDQSVDRWSTLLTSPYFISVFHSRFCRHSYSLQPLAEGRGSSSTGDLFLLSPITDWNVSLWVFSFIPADFNSSHMLCNFCLCCAFTAWWRICALKSKRRHQDLLSDWVKRFPFYKACLPFLNSSDSYEFSNGNLASWVLTKIVLPKHLESSKKMYGLRRAEQCKRTASLPE